MCAYCMIGDHTFKYDPPYDYHSQPFPSPLVPKPLASIKPWTLERLKEYRDILLQVKELEDKLGCPCEPNKADYLKILKDRIEKMEAMG